MRWLTLDEAIIVTTITIISPVPRLAILGLLLHQPASAWRRLKRPPDALSGAGSCVYLTQSVSKVVLQKLIPTQI